MSARPLALPPAEASRLAPRAALALVVSTLCNALLWGAGSALGRMSVGLGEVVLFSALAVCAGVALRIAVERWAKQPATSFVRVCAGVLVLYALGPLSAAYAPYMEGAETFTVVTVVATELMHLVSGAAVVLALAPTAARAVA
jgi:hypothetical protein